MTEKPPLTEDEIQKGKEFLRFMSRHLVVLSGLYESYKDGKLFHKGIFAFSGFIMILNDRPQWVTAGHCLDEKFDRPIRAGKLKVIECGLADYFGDKVVDTNKIPFSYEPGCAFYIDKQEEGLDFAVMPLNDLTIQGLIANGVKAVERNNWIHQKELSFEHYTILGIPSHLTECKISKSGRVIGGIQPVMISIESIEGMSGGPIYGFRQNDQGQWTYYVVALQSRWRQKERIIFGCSVPYFAESLHKELEEMLAAESAANVPAGTTSNKGRQNNGT